MKKTLLFILIILTIPLQTASALYVIDPGAPERLKGWEEWVLYGYEEQYLCPAEPGGGEHHCAWPISLSLDLGSHSGSFTAVFELKKEGLSPLPGGPGAWPEQVFSADGVQVAVAGSNIPQVWLPAGRHILRGGFTWPERPETIDLPLGFILNIKLDGRKLDFPATESDYSSGRLRLWLTSRGQSEEAPAEADAADSLKVTINRLIQDSQPQMIKTRLKLIVGGRPREVSLTNALLPETKATYLTSPLPAQLIDGLLRVRVKPGTYEIELDSRSLVPGSESLGPVPAGDEAEFWAFQIPGKKLRLVEVSGAEQIDPSQADIYRPWRGFPVYYMEPEAEGLKFHIIQRGDPEPAPDDLHLGRECWLDYDGQGLSCRDHLSGELRRQRHLNVSQPFSLAQASLSGQPQVITWQTDSKGQKAPGLQLRNGRIDLTADLRMDDFKGILPASGWDHELQTQSQKINLPPGYRLFHASGADASNGGYGGGAGTWTSAWGTLDFFIVLIIAIAVWKLFGLRPGLLALAAMVLCYHELMAPRMVFLHLLACTALLRLLIKPGKARFLVMSWRFVAALTLIILSTLFFVNQVRIALYPQLENPSLGYGSYNLVKMPLLGGAAAQHRYGADYRDYETGGMSYAEMDAVPQTTQNMFNEMMLEEQAVVTEVPVAVPAPAEEFQRSIAVKKSLPAGAAESVPPQGGSYTNRMVRLSQSPDAKVQNSVPRPQWSWRTVYLNFNNIVTADQEVKLYFIGPLAGRLLALVRIALMAALALMFLKPAPPSGHPQKKSEQKYTEGSTTTTGAAVASALLLALIILGLPADTQAQTDFPSREMLDEYRQRLLTFQEFVEPGVPLMRLTITQDRLVMDFEVEAPAESIIGLPTLDKEIFRLDRVTVEGIDLPLMENRGRWLALMPEGVSRLKLSGRLRKPLPKAFQINFNQAIQPRRTELSSLEGWRVEGLEKDGQMVGSALYISPDGEAPITPEDEDQPEASQALDPFFLVQRTISLGLQWQVHTSVRRITPVGSPVSLRLPLLPDENPITSGFRRDDQKLTLNFGPYDTQVSWDSSLPFGEELELTAGDGPWTESWSLDVSPIWRVNLEGPPPVQNMVGDYWQPQWRPWPGESLRLTVDRPQPVPGQYLVVDSVNIDTALGEQNRSTDLKFQVRSSQGGPWSFTLPQGAKVRDFKVNGQNMPMIGGQDSAESNGPSLTASLTAGSHQVSVSWTEDRPINLISATPSLDLGVPTANIRSSLSLPQDRWVLWAWGPVQGPAVQFWPLVAVVLMAAMALRRFDTPLKAGAWFLLGLGLIQINILGAVVVAGWLILLSRRRKNQIQSPAGFNLWQIVLVVWTLAALILVYKGIEHGLLRNPNMLIDGGGSYGQRLAWFSGSADGLWDSGRVFSVSLWLYKALMLAWSLWLAISLIKWLIWGWGSFSTEALWKKKPPRSETEKPLSDYQKRRAALNEARRREEESSATKGHGQSRPKQDEDDES